MSALANRLAKQVLTKIRKYGEQGSLVYPNGVYVSGEVTETPTTLTVQLAGPLDDTQRYSATGADTRITATFYVSAFDAISLPYSGCRITVGGRTWGVVTVQQLAVQGTAVAYQMDVGEIGDE